MSKNSSAVVAIAEQKNEVKIIPLQTSKESAKTEEKNASDSLRNLPIEDLKNRAVALT
ncbi:MAG: hypothetical protein LBO74_02045 [Candidatus Symbiothrix sp.]|jgi:hypothetical protein|nr:hypothetical protein [Candidatus Symbiothrix sp.]